MEIHYLTQEEIEQLAKNESILIGEPPYPTRMRVLSSPGDTGHPQLGFEGGTFRPIVDLDNAKVWRDRRGRG